jgi:hypothetical protein
LTADFADDTVFKSGKIDMAGRWRQKYLNAENAEVRGEAQRRNRPVKAAEGQP